MVSYYINTYQRLQQAKKMDDEDDQWSVSPPYMTGWPLYNQIEYEYKIEMDKYVHDCLASDAGEPGSAYVQREGSTRKQKVRLHDVPGVRRGVGRCFFFAADGYRSGCSGEIKIYSHKNSSKQQLDESQRQVDLAGKYFDQFFWDMFEEYGFSQIYRFSTKPMHYVGFSDEGVICAKVEVDCIRNVARGGLIFSACGKVFAAGYSTPRKVYALARNLKMASWAGGLWQEDRPSDRKFAFASGGHSKLGAGSQLQDVKEDLIRLIWSMAYEETLDGEGMASLIRRRCDEAEAEAGPSE